MCGPSTLASGPVGQHQEVKADERQQWTAGLITDNVSGLHNTKNTIPQLLLCCLRGKRATRISCRFPRIHYIKPHNSCLITPDQTPGFITGSVLICARRATSILYKCITTASDVSSEKITTREQGRIRIETSTTKKKNILYLICLSWPKLNPSARFYCKPIMFQWQFCISKKSLLLDMKSKWCAFFSEKRRYIEVFAS